jgi:hypothetical protein
VAGPEVTQAASLARRAAEDGLFRLAELTRPLSRTLVKTGMLDPRNAFGGPPRS